MTPEIRFVARRDAETRQLLALILERSREQRRFSARTDDLGRLRRLLIDEAVDALVTGRVGAAELVARVQDTLDGTDSTVRRLLVWLHDRRGSRNLTTSLSSSGSGTEVRNQRANHTATRPASREEPTA